MSFRHLLFAGLILAVAPLNMSLANDDAKEEKLQPIRVSRADKAACMPDALRLCRDALPNIYNVLVCFDRQRERISTGCRAVLASYGLQ